MSLRRFDLNLLTVLDALLRHRNVTRAGHEVGLSQSAASHALVRLRHMFDDQLLVKNGRRLILTHRAESILEPLNGVFEALKELLDENRFVPATSTRRFKIGTSDYVAMLQMPSLVKQLNDAAPDITLQMTWAESEIPRKLLSNQLDLAIVPQGTIEDQGLSSKALFDDKLVVLACADHPEIGETIDLDTFLRQPLVMFRRDYEGARSHAELTMLMENISPRTRVIVPEYLMIPFAVVGTRSVALVHRGLAERLRSMAPLKILEPPFPVSRLTVSAYWRKGANADPGHRWFRELVFESVSAPQKLGEPAFTA